MQATSLATRLTRFGLISAILSAGSGFIHAQPASTAYYHNLPPGAIQTPMYQAPAPFVPQPYQQQPYPQPRGYVPPPLEQPMAKPPVLLTKTASVKPKTNSAKKKETTYRPPSTKASSSTSLETKVLQLEANDRRQDLRLNHLERDVGRLPDSIEGSSFHANDSSSKYYTAKPGDTVSEVAAKFGVSASGLRLANGLTGDELRLGQQIRITSASSISTGSSGGVHRVRSGETFTQIAHDHGVSLHALAKANPTVNPDRLMIDERLIIPGGSSRFISTGISSGGSSRSSTTHIVKNGEHPGSIAKKYGISTDALVAANKLKNRNIIYKGQRLIIPGVRSSGAAPQNLAADSETTPIADRLIREEMEPEIPVLPTEPAPSLPPLSNTLTPLVAEKTPAPSPRGVVAYRMERGDTLETVANMFSTTQENIRAMNKLPADTNVKEGDEIIVPSLGAVSLN
jgi:LysM repeat protein